MSFCVSWLAVQHQVPPTFPFMKLCLLNPSQQGQVEWMFAFGLVSDLRLEVISCQRLYISCFSQSIKTSTHTDKLFRCYVRLVWTNLKWMLEFRKIMWLKEMICDHLYCPQANLFYCWWVFSASEACASKLLWKCPGKICQWGSVHHILALELGHGQWMKRALVFHSIYLFRTTCMNSSVNCYLECQWFHLCFVLLWHAIMSGKGSLVRKVFTLPHAI